MPYYRCMLKSPLSITEIEKRLQDKIISEDSFTSNLALMFDRRLINESKKDKTWIGKVSSSEFKIRQYLKRYQNSFQPIIQGKIYQEKENSIIKLNMRLHFFTIFFLILFILFMFYDISKTPKSINFHLQGLFLLILITSGGFVFEVYKSIKLLKAQLNAL